MQEHLAPNITLTRKIYRNVEQDRMALDVSTINGVINITLIRRFDADSAPAIEAELKKITEQHMARVLFDFSKTEYIASAGLRVLLVITRSILKTGGAVALSSLSPQVRQVFEIGGFTKIFSIFDSREEALRSLQK
jgi:anti-anti-sigma factor